MLIYHAKDFIYAGKIEQHPGASGDERMSFLRDVLELLQVADQWDLPELTDEIGRVIDEERLLFRDTYSTSAQLSVGFESAEHDVGFQFWKQPKNAKRRLSSSIVETGRRKTQDHWLKVRHSSVPW
jgi:hypothetical protein